MIQDPVLVFLAVASVVGVSIWLGKRWVVAQRLGSILFSIVLAAVLANLGVIPGSSPAYDVLSGVGVNIAVALILFGVNLRTVAAAGPQMLVAFGLGAAGTIIGVVTALPLVANGIGDEVYKIAGQYTGTYIGGGVNMVAVGRALGTSESLFSAAVAADNVTTTVWMVTCFVIPVVLMRWWQPVASAPRAANRSGEPAVHAFDSSGREMTLIDVAALGVLAFGVHWGGERLHAAIPAIPSILWVTTVALGLAQVSMVRRLAGGPLLGNYMLHLFLAATGAASIVAEILRVGPAVLYFTLIAVAVHGVVLFGMGRVLKIDLGLLTVASQANIGGPASAMALAVAKKWEPLVVPGVAVGLLGYAVGNYLGLAVARIVRATMGA